jgi:hypothetical protein
MLPRSPGPVQASSQAEGRKGAAPAGPGPPSPARVAADPGAQSATLSRQLQWQYGRHFQVQWKTRHTPLSDRVVPCHSARRAGTSETEPSRPLDKAESTSFYSCRFDASRMRVSCQLCTASSEWKILCTLSIILRRRAVLTAGLDVATRTAMSTYLPRPQNRYRGCVSWAKGRYEGGGVALVRVPSNKANALSEAHVVIKAQDTA